MSTFNRIIPGAKWIDLGIPAAELRPNYTLIMGQCFNWKRIDTTDEKGAVSSCWIGMLDSHALAIRQTDTSTLFANLLNNNESVDNSRNDDVIRRLLCDYFQTDHSLETLYGSWNEGCERMKVVTECLKGVRVVRQDPFECLISFICSSNNNIKRISLMLDRLRCRYGRYICTVKFSPDPSNSGSSVSTDCWQVVRAEDNGQSVREELARSLLLSPSAASTAVSPLPSLIKEEISIKLEKNDIKLDKSSIKSEEISTLKDFNGDLDLNDSFQSPRTSAKAKKGTPTQETAPLIHHLFEFPTIENLALASEKELRALGMGYRAKFISGTASLLAGKEGGGKLWLNNIRNMGDNVEVKAERPNPQSIGYVKEEKSIRGVKRVHDEDHNAVDMVTEHASEGMEDSSRLLVQKLLMECPGVGPKVADCVALFSLDQTGSIPVDTHVWQIALRDYDPLFTLRSAKSLTPMVYEQVGTVFRDRFPVKAGWAHSVLFAAELPEFRAKLPLALQTEMKEFIDNSRSAKKIESSLKLEKKKEKIKEKEANPEVEVKTEKLSKKIKYEEDHELAHVRVSTDAILEARNKGSKKRGSVSVKLEKD